MRQYGFLTMMKLPVIHRVPFDRMMIAQALNEDLAIVTADKNISKYGINTIW